jgi:hypothetical protein
MTNRYPWGNQKPSIEKGQTILWPKDTNGVIRSFRLVLSPFSIEGFWLPHWYLLVILLSPFSIEGFWLPYWFLFVIVLSVPFQLKASDQKPSIEKGDNTMTKRYQWGNQRPSIEKGQTILWPTDTNGVIRSLQLKRDYWYLLIIVLSVPFQLKVSDYPIGIFWS